jgi:predicted CoA-binding protein
MGNKKECVAVLGASTKVDRYSNQAVVMLKEYGHDVLPINPTGAMIDGIVSFKRLSDITKKVDTLTMYVNATRSAEMIDDIIKLNPTRIIFNPGSENEKLEAKCKESGIDTLEACTLVMLRTEQF